MPTYREAGVDLDAADSLVDAIADRVTATWNGRVVGGFGGFAAGIRLPAGYREPVLMMSTDGVGTKAEIARLAGALDGLGHDLVAMCVDDLAAAGARPLAMTDYLAVGRLDPERESRLVASIAAGCELAGIALLGGETAEHPGVLDEERFDLAGTALGVVEAGAQIDGSAIAAGDLIVALASPNLRSNGFSLVRSTLLQRLSLHDVFPGTDRTVAAVLLEPSVIYAPAIGALTATAPIHGMAHITGGGLPGNLVRVLPEGLGAVVDRATWDPPAVFDVLADAGGIDHDEMFSVFNMGVGFAVVVAPDAADGVVAAAGNAGHAAWVCGEIRVGPRSVSIL